MAIDRSKKAMSIMQDTHLVPIMSDISMTSSFFMCTKNKSSAIWCAESECGGERSGNV